MSNPVTNADVEDVLSSIRRLVSNTEEKLHPAPKRKASEIGTEDSGEEGKNATAETPMANALVLTSALRVSDPETEDDEARDVNPEEGSAVLDNLRTALSQDQSDEYEEDAADETIAEAHEDPAASADDVEESVSFATTEFGDPEPDMEPVHDLAEDELPTEDVTENEDTFEEEPAEVVDWSAETAGVSEEPLQEEVAEPQEDVSDESSDAADAEPEAEPDMSDAWETPTEPEDHDDNVADTAEEEVWTGPEGEDEPEEDTASAETHEESYADNQLAAAFTSARRHNEMRNEPQPEDSDDDTLAGLADSPEGDRLSDLDEAVIDEETLRDLVAEIVRQELTGTLGERITRNVRKLVRREIHRAMLTRDFD